MGEKLVIQLGEGQGMGRAARMSADVVINASGWVVLDRQGTVVRKPTAAELAAARTIR